ncbi:hypothetical protein [Streptomyces sp. R41]|uniref:Uncharacterized protein n=1 Tax=Streptomyces sp. R41 TaxID=3238632 RepID=A0AB39RRS3_9ACTN
MNRQPQLRCWSVWSCGKGEIAHAGEGLDGAAEAVAALTRLNRARECVDVVRMHRLAAMGATQVDTADLAARVVAVLPATSLRY